MVVQEKTHVVVVVVQEKIRVAVVAVQEDIRFSSVVDNLSSRRLKNGYVPVAQRRMYYYKMQFVVSGSVC